VRPLVLAFVLGAAGIPCPLRAQGGPPLETDDPGTPGDGRVELNISVEAERARDGTVYDLPRLDANLGVGARVQLKLEVPWRVVTTPPGPMRAGVGNMILGVKWRFAESGTVALSTYPQLALRGSETASAKGLAEGRTAVLLPVEVAWSVGALSFDAEAGYQHASDESEVVYGLALAYQALASLELLGECHGEGDSHFTALGTLCGVGLRWRTQEWMSVLAALSAAVSGSVERRPDRRVYTGIQLRW
jgi:hypothetical protein